MTQEANLTQQVKDSSATQDSQEMQDQSLGQKDPLEEEMATRSSIVAWRIPWTEEPGGLQSKESKNTTKHSTQHPCIICMELSVHRSQCSEGLVPPHPAELTRRNVGDVREHIAPRGKKTKTHHLLGDKSCYRDRDSRES